MKSAGEGLRFFCALQGGNDMAYVKEHAPSEVYHLAKKENLNSILEDGVIRRFSDTECWFCADLQKMRAYMEQTVMCEGKPYYICPKRSRHRWMRSWNNWHNSRRWRLAMSSGGS